MLITPQDISRLKREIGDSSLKKAVRPGGPSAQEREAYFALLYLQKKFGREMEELISQVDFRGNEGGIDAFHWDGKGRFHLFQFLWSDEYRDFQPSLEKLIQVGMERVFQKGREGAASPDKEKNPLLRHLRETLLLNRRLVREVQILFVFNGNPDRAYSSLVLESLREDLKNKRYLLDQFFDRPDVALVLDFKSNRLFEGGEEVEEESPTAGRSKAAEERARPRDPAPEAPSTADIQARTFQYEVESREALETETPAGEKLSVGFMRLWDLYRMYREMGLRFFERNIRAGLDADKAPNKALRKTFERIALAGDESAEAFVFNHNGVTLSVEKAERKGGTLKLIEPRLLNGAQTVSSLHRFIEDQGKKGEGKKLEGRLSRILVVAKVIEAKSRDFVVNVTINNNRQNPVMPWNLRANDLIQLQFQDWFRDELRIFYERQENVFETLDPEALRESGLQDKAIDIQGLARTFLAFQGEVDKMQRLGEVFEYDKLYHATFREGYLKADPRRVVLAYKIQYYLSRIIREVVGEDGERNFYFARARSLLWALLIQGLFNQKQAEEGALKFGTDLIRSQELGEGLQALARRQVVPLVRQVVAEHYAEAAASEQYAFLRTKAVYQRCQEQAAARFGWTRVQP